MLLLLTISNFIHDILQNPGDLFHPETLITIGGLLILFIVVYCQTGVFFFFFLPGDALIFTAGVFISTGVLNHNIHTVCFTLSLAALLGSLTGYWFGRKTGPLLFKRKDSPFFKQEHMNIAQEFYKKYGALALTAGLFFPIIRTFAPIVAGVIKLPAKRFLLFTGIGSVLWIFSLVWVGNLLGRIFFVREHLEYIILAIIIVITAPIIIRMMIEIKKLKKEQQQKQDL